MTTKIVCFCGTDHSASRFPLTWRRFPTARRASACFILAPHAISIPLQTHVLCQPNAPRWLSVHVWRLRFDPAPPQPAHRSPSPAGLADHHRCCRSALIWEVLTRTRFRPRCFCSSHLKLQWFSAVCVACYNSRSALRPQFDDQLPPQHARATLVLRVTSPPSSKPIAAL